MKMQWEIYAIDATRDIAFLVISSEASSIALIHQVRTLKAEHLTDRRGTVKDEDARTAVKEAMAAYFGF